MRNENIRNLTMAAMFAAAGVLLSGTSIPVGVTRCFPFQHTINVLCGVMLGPWWAAGAAFVTSFVRVSMGTGTLFAFPGSIFGALAAGFAARYLERHAAQHRCLAAVAEPVATCTIGVWVCAALLGPAMGKSVGYVFLASSFAASSVPGALLGGAVVFALKNMKQRNKAAPRGQ